MTKIVNLSAIHTLRSILSVLDNFATLCDLYGQSHCPSWLSRVNNKAWIAAVYKWHDKSLIQPYKLGKISTEQFLDGLLNIFKFVSTADLSEAKARLLKKQGSLWSSRLGDLVNLDGIKSDELIIKQLLEESWNSIADFTEADVYKLDAMLSHDDEVYLISNSNELNIHHLLQQMRRLCPNIQWADPIDTGPGNGPIVITDKIKLLPSYRCHAFKTEMPVGTPTLLEHLLANELRETAHSEISVISQFDADLAQAIKIGVPAVNCSLARDVFLQHDKEASSKPRHN